MVTKGLSFGVTLILVATSVALVQGLAPVALGQDSTFPPLLINGPNLWPLNTCSCLTTCISSSQIMGTQVIGKGEETTLASSFWREALWGPGFQCLLSARVHLWREMRVCGMIK